MTEKEKVRIRDLMIAAIVLLCLLTAAFWFVGYVIAEILSAAAAHSDITEHLPSSYASSLDDDHLFYPTTDDIMEAMGDDLY